MTCVCGWVGGGGGEGGWQGMWGARVVSIGAPSLACRPITYPWGFCLAVTAGVLMPSGLSSSFCLGVTAGVLMPSGLSSSSLGKVRR